MSRQTEAERVEANNQRWELLRQIDGLTEKPLIALSFVWLLLLIVDLTTGLHPWLARLSTAIWIIFGLDFVLGIIIAPSKRGYLRSNWLTAVSLLLPALRVLRIFRALRVLRAARAIRSVNLVRVLTSLNRGMGALGKTAGERGVGYVVALTIIVTFTGAAGMAFFESSAAVESGRNLGSYADALWWTAMIMTTLGSDYWPQTLEGRILGWLLALYAFAVFGYITATLASFFIGRDVNRTAAGDLATKRRADDTLLKEVAALRAQVARLSDQLTAPESRPAVPSRSAETDAAAGDRQSVGAPDDLH